MRNLSQGPSGGHGGHEHIFTDEPLPNSRAVEIRVWYGRRIDSVQMILNTGEIGRHGGDGGDDFDAFKLRDQEYITQIEVNYGREVDSMTIHTNQRTSDRFGGDGGDATAVYEATEKTRIVGFNGRSDKLIDALGVVLQED